MTLKLFVSGFILAAFIASSPVCAIEMKAKSDNCPKIADVKTAINANKQKFDDSMADYPTGTFSINGVDWNFTSCNNATQTLFSGTVDAACKEKPTSSNDTSCSYQFDATLQSCGSIDTNGVAAITICNTPPCSQPDCGGTH